MKESTKELFLKPLLFQESILAIVVVPVLLSIVINISKGAKEHYLAAASGAFIAINIGLISGVLVKYSLVRPAINLMGKERNRPDEVLSAVRSIAILPLAEAITIFLRWCLSNTVVVILYAKGFLGFSELLMGVNTLLMTGLLCIPFFYLYSENSTVSFFRKSNMKGIMDKDRGLFCLSLNKKLLISVLFISIPPLGIVLGAIALSIETGVSLSVMRYGFFFIVLQTIFMTFMNGYLLMRSLSLSVGSMSVMLEDMAKGHGDLTKRLHVAGLHEVGKLAFWFNEFLDDLEEIIQHVKGTSSELNEAIGHVSTGSQELNNAIQEEAASVEEVSASIEEMNTTVQNNAELINEGRDTSNVVTKLIDQSKIIFSDLMKAMQGISQDSRKIGDIVVTVNDVAFHTNLLALNASVEAARAGEHGKGFAVVAEEVRSLAQRSAGAAREIKILIEGSVNRIKNGDEMVQKTSTSLEELMSRMEIFFRMMEVISTSSSEQTQNIRELNRAISQIDSSTQKNATTVEELASVMDNLKNMAYVLAEDVNKFKVSLQ